MKQWMLTLLALGILGGIVAAQSTGDLDPMTRRQIAELAKKQVGNLEMTCDAKLLCTVWLLKDPWKMEDFIKREVYWYHLASPKEIKFGDAVVRMSHTTEMCAKAFVYLGENQDGEFLFVTSSEKGGVLVKLKWAEIVPDPTLPLKYLGLRRYKIEEPQIIEGPTGENRGISATFYAQCDSRWRNDVMGGGSTLCSKGCLVTSMSMATSGPHNDPGQLNSWLKSNGGYSGNSFVWQSVDGYFGFDFVSRISSRPAASDLRTWLGWGRIIVANVNNGGHWVLLLDHDGGTNFKCHDPGTSSGANKWITHTEIVGAGVYQR